MAMMIVCQRCVLPPDRSPREEDDEEGERMRSGDVDRDLEAGEEEEEEDECRTEVDVAVYDVIRLDPSFLVREPLLPRE